MIPILSADAGKCRATLWAVLFFLAGQSLCLGQTGVESARAHRDAHGAEIIQSFTDLLAIPNVASDSVNIWRSAQWIEDAFESRGVEIDLLSQPGVPPLVYGRLDVPGATRTLGIYVHYDGQPVDETRWEHSPWTPTLYDKSLDDEGQPISMPQPGDEIDPEWRLYARSAGDDKAPVIALLAAIDALREGGNRLTSNLVLMFEGEEEAGSRNLDRYLETHKEKLDVDVWLIFDGPVHQSRTPQLVFGVRGVTGFEVTVYGANRSLHSGHYGNWSPNPGLLLSQLLSSMKDEQGNVVIDGFYDTTEPVGEAEKEALAAIPFVDDDIRRSFGLVETDGGMAPLAERLLLPSLNIRGIETGNVGSRARNVIPMVATASLDVRLVKGNDPADMIDRVEAHIRSQGYHIVREDPDDETRLAHPRIAKVTRNSGYPAARSSMDAPIAKALRTAAEEAAGETIIMSPSLGGSLPLYLFNEILERPVIIVPIANHDNNQHAANENLRIANLWYGIDLMAAILTMNLVP